MTAGNLHFAPPDDVLFHGFLLRASRGKAPVYGAVIETAKVSIVRAFDSHRPETMEGGQDIVEQMFMAWQAGQPVQPWLYAKGGRYVVADDYFWLALIERGRPRTLAAQVLGEPLADGLIQKVGPLGPGLIHERFGKL